MRVLKLSIAAALAAFAAQAATSPALAETENGALRDRLTLTIANAANGDASRPELKVSGSGSKFDRIETSSLRAVLDLSAQPTDMDAYKIVRSRLSLIAGSKDQEIDTLPDTLPNAAFSAKSAYELPIALDSQAAQTAIDVCNAIPSAERDSRVAVRRTMPVAVKWQVTTGRFAFKWTNYDRVAPSDEILRNPDFYADQAVQSAESTIDVDVTCAPLPTATIAAKPAAENPVRRVALTSAPAMKQEPAKPADVQKVSQADLGKPRCDGGMVRQISTAAESYLCLCPGNTMRVETGDNAFACERRARR